MDVGVQKTGQDDLAGHVYFLGAAVLPHAYNQTLRHSDVGGAQFIGEHIHIGGIFQNQVRRLPAGGRVDDAPLFQQLPVDLSSIALRHRTRLLYEFLNIQSAYCNYK